MEEKLCSIIIPVYNREFFVEKTVLSCMNQTYSAIEVIIVDDGSTDNSLNICKNLQDKYGEHKIKILHQANSGACVARNIGLESASGDYIMFLDSDDEISFDKIRVQVHCIEINNSDCSICDFAIINQSGGLVKEIKNDHRISHFIKKIISPSNSALLIRKSTIPKSLRWNVKLKRMQDVDFMLRYLSVVSSMSYVPQVLYYYRVHNNERISDGYIKGLPYFRLLQSYVSFYFKKEIKCSVKYIDLICFVFRSFILGVRDEISINTPKVIKVMLKKRP